MELRHLRYFLAVADESHFRRAAEALLVSQPTLSLQVRELEKELGVDLFERVGRRVRLTQAGHLYREHARRALAVLDEGQVAISELDGLVRGSLTVGAVQSTNAYLLPRAVARFATDHPNVRLRVEELSAAEIEGGIRDGSLDLGISFQPALGGGIESRPLFEEELVVATGPDHRFAKRRRIALADLEGVPLCLLGSKYCTRRMIDECFATAGVTPLVLVEMNSVEGVVAAVEAGGPATILPALAVESRPLRLIRIAEPTPTRTISLLSRSGQASLRARNVFAELIRAGSK